MQVRPAQATAEPPATATTDALNTATAEPQATTTTEPPATTTTEPPATTTTEPPEGAEPLAATTTTEEPASPGTVDTDGDGLSGIIEQSLGTDPDNPDTDGDGFSDSLEVTDLNSDPLDPNDPGGGVIRQAITRSEEHTSELHSHLQLACRLLLAQHKT